MANHGGGYGYRLAPADAPLTEETFRRLPLDMVGKSMLRWDGDRRTQLEFDAARVSHGTTPAGSMWAKNPVPSGIWNREGPGFDPLCVESAACKAYYSGLGDAKQGMCRCSGWSNGGPLLPNLEIVDNLQIPAGLAPGRYVLQWRWDCEESDQVRDGVCTLNGQGSWRERVAQLFERLLTDAARRAQVWASCADVEIA